MITHLEKQAEIRYQNRINRAMKTGIVYGNPDHNTLWHLKFKLPFEQVLGHPDAATVIRDKIQQVVLPDLQPGDKILNTNIPLHVLVNSGLKESQYVQPMLQEKLKQPAKIKAKPAHQKKGFK